MSSPELQQAEEWEERAKLLKELGRFEEAIAAQEKAIALRENFVKLNAESWFKQGYQQHESGDFEAAVASYDKALEFYSIFYQAWNNRGNVLADLNQFEEALESYNKALAIEPNLWIGWYNLGRVLVSLKRFEEAVSTFDRVLEINPNCYEVWNLRGNALSALKSFEEVIANFDKALDIKLSDHLAWYNRGVALTELKRFKEAIINYDRALDIEPNFVLAWYNRGVTLCYLKRFEEAITNFDRAIDINPSSYEAWNSRGAAFYHLNKFEEAITNLDKAIDIEPNYYEAWNHRGLVLYHLNQFEEALANFDRALEINPNYYEAWDNKGSALTHLNRFEQALTVYDHALRIQPDSYLTWINRAVVYCHLYKTRHLQTSLIAAIEKTGKQAFNHISSLQEAIPHLSPETYGYGQLFLALAEAYYEHSAYEKDFHSYCQNAIQSYLTALSIFTEETFPEDRLTVLQRIIHPLLSLEESKAAGQYCEEGLELFRRLLNQQPTTRQKRLLEVKFSGFSQIAVDALISNNQITIALETAERYKNRCLTWILDEWKETAISPSYAEMRQLLKASTAIVYWHLSEDALTTFILTPNLEDPILLDSDRTSLTQRQQKLDQWMKRWDEHYNDYRSKGKEQSESKANHPWRINLKSNLDELREILGIATIKLFLSNITNLILVPHRDLHRFPLHALFSEDYTISYLPSLQIGLNLRQKTTPQTKFLLSVEDPARDDIEPMKFAQLESAILRSLFSPNVKSISPNESDRATVETALKENQGIFHFTGHGRYDSRQPENSELILKGTDNLTAKEISHTSALANYHLVCLSACETGISGVQTIQTEYVGLASAFLKAGVSNVISTLWTVEEVSNAYLMIRFYQFWLSGEPPAIALKNAQHWLKTVTNANLLIWLKSLLPLVTKGSGAEEYLNQTCIPEVEGRIEKNQPPYCDPYYWAAFTLTGKSL